MTGSFDQTSDYLLFNSSQGIEVNLCGKFVCCQTPLYGHPLNYYGQFALSLGKALTFSLNLTRLKRTPLE